MSFFTYNLIAVPLDDLIADLNGTVFPELASKFTGGLQSHSIANTGGSLTPAASVFQGRASKFTGNISSDRDVIQPLTDTPAGPNVVWNIARPPDAAGYAAAPRYVTLKVTSGSNEVGFGPGFSRLVGHDGTELRAWTPEYNPTDDTAKVSGLAVGTGTRNATSGFIEPAIPNQRTGGAAGYQVINARRIYTDLDKHAPGVYDPTTGNGPYIISKFEGISSYLQVEATGNLASDQEIYGTRSLVQEQSVGRTHAGKILGNTGEVFNSGTSRLEVVYCDWKLFNQSSSGNGGLIVGDLHQIDTSVGSTGLLDITVGALSQYTLAGGTDITSARGFESALSITGATTDLGVFYHFRADTPTLASGATIGTLYGVRIFDQAGVTGVTAAYNLYSSGNGLNVLESGLVGSIAANGDLVLNGTSHATKTTSNVYIQSAGGWVGIGTADVEAWTGMTTAIESLDTSVSFGLDTDVYVNSNAYYASGWKYKTADLAGQYAQYKGTHVWNVAASGSGDAAITFVQAMKIDAAANVIVGNAALATNATDGFLYIPTCAGTPTGTPTAQTGRSPLVIDTTNSKLYAYFGGGWKGVTLV